MAPTPPAAILARYFFGACLLLAAVRGLEAAPVPDDAAGLPAEGVVTNMAQLQALPNLAFLRSVPIRLEGLVTHMDLHSGLVVIQDDTGAVAVDLKREAHGFGVGDVVRLEAADSTAYTVSFPNFPFYPSGSDVRPLFEAPANWGDFHLTRMRGFLHPPATGEYTFWIASDNSSELWLSSDEDPAHVQRIAYLRQGDWVNSREWSRYASQQSKKIFLEGRQTYYIEAFQEQLLVDDNLAVAWQVEGMKQSVIDGRHLSPWVEGGRQSPLSASKGILREYWTNYSAGNLAGLTGPRSFNSALAVKGGRVTVLGKRGWPDPQKIALDQPLRPEDRYRWVEVEGLVSFRGTDEEFATLELTEGQARVRVQAPGPGAGWPRPAQHWRVRVRGVCEGAINANGQLMPGFIWAPTDRQVEFLEGPGTNVHSTVVLSPRHFTASSGFTNQAWGGFLSARGVVTFNDRVEGRDCLFIQDDMTGIFVSQEERVLGDQLEVGQWVEVGGGVQPGHYAPNLHPMVVTVLGARPMPEPAVEPVEQPVPASRDGQWTEVEGVVRATGTNNNLLLMGAKGPLTIWVGRMSAAALKHYVDCTVRVRGVLSLTLQTSPRLLVPSAGFLEVEQEAPQDPFLLPARTIADIAGGAGQGGWVHRVKIIGELTSQSGRVLFIQDATGGCRVEMESDTAMPRGEWVEVAGFPDHRNGSLTLMESILRPADARPPSAPRPMDLAARAAIEAYDGVLVECRATLLAQREGERTTVLELQSGMRVFEARLATTDGTLPLLESGSTLRVTGICKVDPVLDSTRSGRDASGATSFEIRLRDPADVVVLSGPPLWNWKEAAVLTGLLVLVLASVLVRVFVMRRRFERQESARRAFSRLVLESQERERHRIAANLHDSLGQSLLIIKNQARMAMHPVTDAVAKRRLDEISDVASQAIQEVRQITRDLRPYQLDTLGLTQALRAVIQRVTENSTIQFQSQVDDIDGLFDSESEIHVYRIVQECLNNVVKHSAAEGAVVLVQKQAGSVCVSVRDNGRGFDARLLNSTGFHDSGGLGLSNIGERSRILGGRLTVESESGKGAHLMVIIPCLEKQHAT
ncbi:MAG: histidine kinase [Verrucomicrobiota bacterium]